MTTPLRSMLLGTTNPAKQKRLAWLLDGLGLDLVSPDDLGLDLSNPEQGSSHRAIAEEKACAWSQAVEGLAIASDGGVVIPALGGAWDSLRTHRFAGEGATDQQRQEQLLQLMRGHTGKGRRISWSEAVAVADNGALVGWWEERGVEGVLAAEAFAGREIPGLWVASLLYFPTLDKYYPELNAEELEALGDHWTSLRPRVRAFLREWLAERR